MQLKRPIHLCGFSSFNFFFLYIQSQELENLSSFSLKFYFKITDIECTRTVFSQVLCFDIKSLCAFYFLLLSKSFEIEEETEKTIYV